MWMIKISKWILKYRKTQIMIGDQFGEIKPKIFLFQNTQFIVNYGKKILFMIGNKHGFFSCIDWWGTLVKSFTKSFNNNLSCIINLLTFKIIQTVIMIFYIVGVLYYWFTNYLLLNSNKFYKIPVLCWY